MPYRQHTDNQHAFTVIRCQRRKSHATNSSVVDSGSRTCRSCFAPRRSARPESGRPDCGCPAGLVGIRLQAPLNRVACHTQDPGDMADGFVFFKNKLPHKKTAFFGNHGFGTSVVMNNGTHDPRLSRHCKSTSRRGLEVGQN